VFGFVGWVICGRAWGGRRFVRLFHDSWCGRARRGWVG